MLRLGHGSRIRIWPFSRSVGGGVGSSCEYIRVTDPGTYDPTTGKVTSAEKKFDVKAVMRAGPKSTRVFSHSPTSN